MGLTMLLVVRTAELMVTPEGPAKTANPERPVVMEEMADSSTFPKT